MINMLSKKIKFNYRAVKAEWYFKKYQFQLNGKPGLAKKFVFYTCKRSRLKYCERQAPKLNRWRAADTREILK